MTFAEFSRMNRARSESPNGFNHKLDLWSLSDWFTATMGELGEAANVAKKLNRVRDGIPGNSKNEDELRADLADEIADVFIYLDLMAQSAGLDLETIAISKFRRTSEKIGYVAEEVSEMSVNGCQAPPSPPIGKAPYNTPTTFEEAVKSEPAPPQASGPAVEETPLPGGYKAILDERFSELCVEWTGRIATRRGQRSPSSVVKDLAFLDSPFLVHVVDQCRLALKVFGSDTYDASKLEAATPPPEPVIPLPEGCTAIDGYPLLCVDEDGEIRLRSNRYRFLPMSMDDVGAMRWDGVSEPEIKQVAEYMINHIAAAAGLSVTIAK